jgi:hypothetical protein
MGMRIDPAEVFAPDPVTKIASIGFCSPHFRKAGEYIAINGVLTGALLNPNNSYNNYVLITSIENRLKLKVQLPSTLNATQPVNLYQEPGIICNFQIFANNGGLGGGNFSNRMVHVFRGGSYQVLRRGARTH